jgi:hypothetical protein
VKESKDEELNQIAELLPPKPDYPEGQAEQRQPQQNMPPQQPQLQQQQSREEVKRKPEDRLPYEKPSRELPCWLEVKTHRTISIKDLLKERYPQTLDTEEGKIDDDPFNMNSSSSLALKDRKRQREDDDSSISSKLSFGKSKDKRVKADEIDSALIIDVTEDDSETRKRTFKTYCEYKHRYDTLMKRGNPEEREELKKFEIRLNKGLLISCNRQSKFRRICELYLKDRCSFFEKRK